MKRKLRNAEWMMLMLPCMALAVFAVWQGQRSNTSSASNESGTLPKIVVLKSGLVPVSPRDASKGWDTKYVVEWQFQRPVTPPNAVASGPGVGPVSCGLYFRNSNRNVALLSGKDARVSCLIEDVHKVTFFMKLRDVPLSSSPTLLKGVINAEYGYVQTRNGIKSNLLLRCKPFVVSTVVRMPNQRIGLLPVSHYCPLTIQNIVASSEAASSLKKTGTIDTTVDITLQRVEEAKDDTLPIFYNARLEDEYGRNCNSVMMESGPDQSGDHIRKKFMLLLSTVPKSAGRITFKAEASVNDCWPLPLSIVVRNRSGKVPYGAAKNERAPKAL